MIEQSVIEGYIINQGISPEKEDIAKLYSYLDILFEYNKNVNLVGTKNRDEILTRHFLDCLSTLSFLNCSDSIIAKPNKILDIGTGAGLPGILLSIFLKNTELYLLDSKNKSIIFLKIVKDALKLNNVHIIAGRAEEVAHDKNYREKFDFVVSRALAKTSILTELAAPFCKVGGSLVLYKSKNLTEELKLSNKIIAAVGGEVEKIIEVKVPCLDEYRALLIQKKIKLTENKYPRKYCKILSEPV